MLFRRCRASLGRRDRGQAEHRSTWLAADEQPLLGLAGDPEQAERLGPAIDVDLGVDQKIVTQDRDRVSWLRGVDVRGDDLRDRPQSRQDAVATRGLTGLDHLLPGIEANEL